MLLQGDEAPKEILQSGRKRRSDSSARSCVCFLHGGREKCHEQGDGALLYTWNKQVAIA